MRSNTSISTDQQALPGLARIPLAKEYDEVCAFLAEMALADFEALMEQRDRSPSVMEQVAAAPQYLRAVHAYSESLELQLSTSNFPQGELEEVENQVQVAGIMGRPQLLRPEFQIAARILRQRLELNLFYLETMKLRIRGCTEEAQCRLDRHLLELQLQLEQYQVQAAPTLQLAAVSLERESATDKLRFFEVMDNYLRNHLETNGSGAVSQSTQKKYRMQLKLIGRLLNNPYLEDITPGEVALLHKRLANLPKKFRKISNSRTLRVLLDTPEHGQPLLSASTRSGYHARARQILRFAFREHYTRIDLANC